MRFRVIPRQCKRVSNLEQCSILNTDIIAMTSLDDHQNENQKNDKEKTPYHFGRLRKWVKSLI